MTTTAWLTTALCLAVGVAGGLAVPALVRRLPEPPLGDQGASEADEPVAEGATIPPKVPYAALAAAPGLGPVSAAVAGLACALVGWRTGPDPAAAPLVYLCVVGVLLAYVDLRVHLLPNAVVLPSYAVVGAGLLLVAAVGDAWPALLGAAAGLAVSWGLLFVLLLVHPAGMGFGDVKLAGLLGLALGWLGLPEVLVAAFTAFLLGGLTGLALLLCRRAGRRTAIPFGPFLLIGYLVAVAAGEPIARWYLGA